MAQWIKASERLPEFPGEYFLIKEPHKPDAEKWKDCCFWNGKEFWNREFQEVISGTDLIWLDESPSTIPASVEEAARYREALEKIQERCIEGIYTEVDVAFIHETTTEALNNK